MTSLQRQVFRMLQGRIERHYGPGVTYRNFDQPFMAAHVTRDERDIFHFYRPGTSAKLAYLVALLDRAQVAP